MSRKKIGIVLPFQNGDLATGLSIMRYREELWPDCDIVWFTVPQHEDLLKYQDVEIRNFPHGWNISQEDMYGKYAERIKKDKLEGMPEWEDLSLAKDENNRLNQELKHRFPSVADLDEAYFAAPWMLSTQQRHGVDYPNCSKMVFGIPNSYEWHPVLKFSDEEIERANLLMNYLPQGVKNVFVETFAGSSQSSLTEEMNERNMWLCRQYWPNCNFIFGSHKFLRGQEEFPNKFFEREGVYSCADFTVRQTALISGACDLILSVSSGLTVAASCWENMEQEKIPPVIQYTGSFICSTKSLYEGGQFELITADHKSFEASKDEFQEKLISLLIQHT